MDSRDTHQYALDVCGQWVNAEKECKKRKREYFCSCPERHRLKLVKPSGLPGKRPFKDFFAHITNQSSGARPSCVSCGESKEHRTAKQILRERFGKYSFVKKRCPKCLRADYWQPSENGSIRLEVSSKDGLWRYDCMVVEGGKPVYALEVYHRHRTDDVKVERTRQDGIEIAEFSSEEILDMQNDQVLTNLLCKYEDCKSCKNIEIFSEAFQAWLDEIKTVSDLDSFDLWEKARIRDLLKKQMWGKSNFDRAVLILQYRKVCIHRSFGEDLHVSRVLQKLKQVKYGIIVNEEKYMGIVLEDTPHHIVNIMNHALMHGIERDMVYLIWAGTVISENRYSLDDVMSLKDCKWPILKELETQHHICSYCFKYGHHSSRCLKKSKDQMGLSSNKFGRQHAKK